MIDGKGPGRPRRGFIEERKAKAGYWSFTVRWEEDGEPQRLVVHRDEHYERGRAIAEQELAKLRLSWATATARDRRQAARTWEEAAEAFLAWTEKYRRPRTHSRYRNVLSVWERWRPKLLENTSTAHLERMQDALEAEGYAASTINNYVATVGRAWRWFSERRRRWVKGDPFADLEPLQAGDHDSPPRILSSDEIATLRESLGPPWLDVFEVALRTGLRAGELVHLDGDDVDLDRRSLTVRAKEGWRPKNKRRRSVPVHADLLPVFRPRVRGRNGKWPVFPHPADDARRYLGLRSGAWEAMTDVLGANTGLHVLRATFASRAVETVGLKQAQAWLGHSRIETTERYLAAIPRHEQQAIDTIDFG